MYAIAFDLNTDELKNRYHNDSWNNAYGDVGKFLEARGFLRQQKSVYFGDASVNAVTCVLVIMELTRQYAWFGPSVTDIRMLRIEDNNDLTPAIHQAIH
jgi:virulence-associated protein VapD